MKQRILLLVPALLLNACYAYTPAIRGTPEAQISAAGSPKSVVRLSLKNRTPFDMRNPRIVGDSVIGIDDLLKTRTAVLLADVNKAEVRYLDGRATAGAAVGTVAGIGVAFFILAAMAVSSSLGGN